ncbi:hypothetical protein [Olsenella sp. AGMB03486]|uniref:hypothetical protein n=1 Tax=Olsenella sp. AGMB03486 TaxID=3230364 RepID=UPI0034A025FB
MGLLTRRSFFGLAAALPIFALPATAQAEEAEGTDDSVEDILYRMKNDLPESFRYDMGEALSQPDTSAAE